VQLCNRYLQKHYHQLLSTLIQFVLKNQLVAREEMRYDVTKNLDSNFKEEEEANPDKGILLLLRLLTISNSKKSLQSAQWLTRQSKGITHLQAVTRRQCSKLEVSW
jgi:hypothetical protein